MQRALCRGLGDGIGITDSESRGHGEHGLTQCTRFRREGMPSYSIAPLMDRERTLERCAQTKDRDRSPNSLNVTNGASYKSMEVREMETGSSADSDAPSISDARQGCSSGVFSACLCVSIGQDQS